MTKTSNSINILAEPVSRQSDKEVDQDGAGERVGPVDDSLNVIGPLSLKILMYSLEDRMFIEGLKALSKEWNNHERRSMNWKRKIASLKELVQSCC